MLIWVLVVGNTKCRANYLRGRLLGNQCINEWNTRTIQRKRSCNFRSLWKSRSRASGCIQHTSGRAYIVTDIESGGAIGLVTTTVLVTTVVGTEPSPTKV